MESFAGLCSIEIGSEGIAVAYTPNTANIEISVCEFQPYQGPVINSQPSNDQIKECLEKIVSKHSLKKTHCTWVLHPDYYRLTLINIPNVPQLEYKTAVRWQIKDIINYPLEDATVDIFYPDEPQRALKKIYVIAAQNSFLQNIVDIIQYVELYPIAIDIHEFAIRNLITKLAKQDETVGLLHIINDSCLMVSVKNNNIQFVRRIPVGLKSLSVNNYKELISELQRSFSYCQTELNQEIPAKIFMPPKMEADKSIAQNIATNLNKDVSILNLQEAATFKIPINRQIESSCWITVGGLMRPIFTG